MVLGAIRAQPSHGYAIAEMLDDGLGGTVGLTKATVYATLRRFEERGWITGARHKDSGFPERQVFQGTDAGNEAYLRLLADGAAEERAILSPLVALLCHVDSLPEADKRDALESLHRVRRAQIRRLERFPMHQGSAGVAIKLLLAQLRLESDALTGLLD